MRIGRYKQGRHWAVWDDAGNLVVVTVYKKGAVEVLRRLSVVSAVVSAAEERSPAAFPSGQRIRKRKVGSDGYRVIDASL